MEFEIIGSGLRVAIPRAIGANLQPQGIIALLGRDVLTAGTLFYNGFTGQITFASSLSSLTSSNKFNIDITGLTHSTHAQGAVNNTITKNNVSGNQYDLFDSNGPLCVNTWKQNGFQTSGGAVACIN